MKRIVTMVLGVGAAFSLTAGPAVALHPKFDVPNTPQVPAHQHYVDTPGGLVPVGPNACEDGMSIQFDHFHLNVHRGEPGTRGVVVARPCPDQP